MAHTNQIRIDAQDPNPFDFDDMAGVLHGRGQQLQTLTRLGKDDQEVRNTGIRARVSTLIATRYYLSRADAIQAMDAYRASIGNVREVVKHSQSHGNFRIVDVQQAGDMRAIENAIGTLDTNPKIKMRIRWHLRARL